MVTADNSNEILVTPEEVKNGIEIEKKIVDDLLKKHDDHINGLF